MWNTHKGFDDDDLLSSLPSSLHTDVSMHLASSTLCSHALFQGLDIHFLNAVVKVLLQRTLVPDEIIIREGDTDCDAMYFIRTGIIVITVSGRDRENEEPARASTAVENAGATVRIAVRAAALGRMAAKRVATINANKAAAAAATGAAPDSASLPKFTLPPMRAAPAKRHVQTCVDGDLIGEFGVLLSAECPVRTSTATALSYCDLYVLLRDDLANLLSFYPNVQTELETRTARRRALVQKKESNIFNMGGEGEGGTALSAPNSAATAKERMKIEKMKQLLGGANAAGGGAGSNAGGAGSNASAAAASTSSDGKNGAIVILSGSTGKPLDPHSWKYKILLWMRSNWLTSSAFYSNWTRLIAGISLYNALCVPFRLAFDFEQAGGGLLFIDYFTDLFLIANVVAHMWLRHPPKLGNGGGGGSGGAVAHGVAGAAGTFETFSEARWRYFKSGWMFWDIITVFPWDIFMLVNGQMNPWFRWMKVMRFATDVSVLSNAKLQSAGLTGSTVGLLQLVIGFVLMVHWASCSYWSFHYKYGFSENYGEWLPPLEFHNEGRFISYLFANYQTLVLLTGLGMKRPPKEDPEVTSTPFLHIRRNHGMAYDNCSLLLILIPFCVECGCCFASSFRFSMYSA
jgi:CRP-like cAMP-binding protein